MLFRSLTIAGGIQGTIADACLRILVHHNIKPVVKWVDDFIFFQELALLPSSQAYPNHASPFQYNLSDVFTVTNPLGIPWHDILKKGQDFAPHFSYVGFHWDIAEKSVSVPEDKRFRTLQKLTSVINANSLYLRDVASILGTLQHLTFVYRDSHHALSSISTFLSKFPNKFVKHHLPVQARHHLTWW